MKVASFAEPVDIVEDVVLTMDFVNDKRLVAGETLATPVVTVTVDVGVDGDVANLLTGSPSISGTKVSVRKARDKGVANCVYAIRFQVDTSNGQRLILVGMLSVKDSVTA